MEVIAPRLEHGAERYADIHHNYEEGKQRAENRQRNRDAAVLDQHSLAGRLAGQSCCALGFEVILLHDEHKERDAEEDDSHCGRAFLIVGTGDLQVDRRRQCIVGTTDDHRVREVGDRLNESDQERVAKSRENQRKRYCHENLPAGRAHIAGSFLEGGIDILEKASHHHVADREESQCLDNGDAPEAVNVIVIDMQQEAGNDTGFAEQHDHGQ